MAVFPGESRAARARLTSDEVCTADGKGAERILSGPVTLPAWSEDGRLIAVTERKDDGARWDISIVRVPDRLRK